MQSYYYLLQSIQNQELYSKIQSHIQSVRLSKQCILKVQLLVSSYIYSYSYVYLFKSVTLACYYILVNRLMSYKKYCKYWSKVLPPIPLVPSQLQKRFSFSPRAPYGRHFARIFCVLLQHSMTIGHDNLTQTILHFIQTKNEYNKIIYI